LELAITDKAANRIREIQKDMNIPADSCLRVSVVSGGCSGLTYDLKFDSEPSTTEKEQILEDKGIKVVVDMRSFLYVAGSVLDFSDGLTGKGFHFNNPNAARSCSCGESFSL
jgi:iron-sulfur cluster assembly protein